MVLYVPCFNFSFCTVSHSVRLAPVFKTFSSLYTILSMCPGASLYTIPVASLILMALFQYLQPITNIAILEANGKKIMIYKNYFKTHINLLKKHIETSG